MQENSKQDEAVTQDAVSDEKLNISEFYLMSYFLSSSLSND